MTFERLVLIAIIAVPLLALGAGPATKPAAGPVERVRVGEPQTGMVRIVLDMKTAAGYRISRNGSVITITIGERAIAAMAASD